MLIGYAQAAAPGVLQLWVGIFGREAPEQPRFELNGAPAVADVVAELRPIRDANTGPTGKPLNHRGIYRLRGTTPARQYVVSVHADGERFDLPTRTLPSEVPAVLDGAFNILLCSCYSQPEDDNGLLGTIVQQIRVRPDLTLMMGDQIYGDLPLTENLPLDEAGVARRIGAKYRQNWASSALGGGGLGPVLARAPALCIPDDHEFWNNYPFKQAQLQNTWSEDGRRNWQAAALALFEDYQTDGPAGGTRRIDVDPLKILAVDMRCLRDKEFDRLMPEAAMADIRKWADDLLLAKRDGAPSFGVLTSGQALFVAPQDDSQKRTVDAEMSNYRQFEDELLPQLERLTDAGIPLIYVTGDVHWGRVAEGVDVKSGRAMLFEVIASPSRLIRVPLVDSAKTTANRIAGIFGRGDPWPRHGEPGKLPERLGGRYQLQCPPDTGFRQKGDHIAMLSFARAGGGVDFSVSYYAITDDKALGHSRTTRSRSLRVI